MSESVSTRIGRRLAARAPALPAEAPSDITVGADDLGTRNRRLARILLAIMGALALAGLLVGIRW
jgi:hypothetical protein